MAYLAATIDVWPLALAVAIGGMTSYVLFELGRRLRGGERGAMRVWLGGGALVAGTGLWGAHFVAMTGWVLPIPIGYAGMMTFVSWLCAVGAAGLALTFAVRERGWPSVAGGACVLAAALCIVHHTALAAAEFAPGVRWNEFLVAASAVVAAVVSCGVLAALDRTALLVGVRGIAVRVGAALAAGVGLAAFDTVAMAAARVVRGAVCVSVFGIDGDRLSDFIAATVPLVLLFALLGSFAYDFVERRRRQLAGSLERVAARLDSANTELRQRAMLDALTGLPNRLLFEDRLVQSLLRIDRARHGVPGTRDQLAVMYIDIDGFKPVNDSFGHAAGDEVIREIGRRLTDAARAEDTVARVGADQFLLLMIGVTSSEDCVALAARILDAARQPMRVGDRKIQVTVSIGVVVYPEHGERTRLLAQADLAMQVAKRSGRGTYALFESHMKQDAADQLDFIDDLRQAVELGQLELHYQPKMDGRRHLLCGVEALLRWHHPDRGTIGPAIFIPIAERCGLINMLGNWVIDEACRQMGAWAKAGVHMRVAINLSVHQLRQADLVPRIESALLGNRVRASQLLCEITESVAMQDIAVTQRTLDQLGKIGVYLAIDDFGTGYSSLSYLRQLPARQLKIDRSFINDLDSSDDAKAVVDGVVRLAHALGLRVVAEGVETANQRDILIALNCDELQGFFVARPMSADRLLAWTNGKKPIGSLDFAQSLMHRSVEVDG